MSPNAACNAIPRCERILQLGLRRVAEGGFAALTMQALADDAGIATGSLYRHFRGKGELAAEIFRRASQREVDALAVVLRGPGAPAWRLAEGLRRFAARAWSSQRLAFALIAEPVDPEVDEQRLRYRGPTPHCSSNCSRRAGAVAHSSFPWCRLPRPAWSGPSPRRWSALSPRRAPLATAASRNRVWSR